MNIHLERSGGFAGLRLSHDVDSSQLSPAEKGELKGLVEASRFFELPEAVRAAKPGADRFQYRVTMNDGGREHTVHVDDAAVPENLRPLLNWVTARARKR